MIAVLVALLCAIISDASSLSINKLTSRINRLSQGRFRGVDTSNITTRHGATISGISSGGYMAVQMQMVYSSTFIGAGVFAGGPFYCAQNSAVIGLTTCTEYYNEIILSYLNTLLKSWAFFGTVDPLSNLLTHRIFMFSGKFDDVVYPGVMKKLLQQYADLNVPSTNIYTEFDVPAQHTWPTLNYGHPCNMTESPFLGNCNYDGAGNALKQLYGRLRPRTKAIPENIKSMATGQFVPTPFSPSLISMDDTFYYYYPTNCQLGTTRNCSVHVALHGCLQCHSMVGDVFVQHGGFNEWAEANDIIILYPQTVPKDIPLNPNACWDWWGYTGIDYSVNTGRQMRTLYNMVKFFSNLTSSTL